MYSLVIVTRNRPRFVKRLLKYYTILGFKNPILIADGSASVDANELAAITNTFSSALAVEHHAHGEDISVWRRLRNVVDKISTPYVAWVGDDDFLIPSALDFATEIIESDMTCAAVVGRAVTFMVHRDEVHGQIVRFGRYVQRSRAEVDVGTRLLSHMMNSFSTAYSLKRTAQFASNLDAVIKTRWSDDHYHFPELLESALTVISGKIIKIERLMMVRQIHQEMSSSIMGQSRSVFDLLVGDSWREYHTEFIAALKVGLQGLEGMKSDQSADDLARLALWADVMMASSRKLLRRLTQSGMSCSSDVKKIIETRAFGGGRASLADKVVEKLRVAALHFGRDGLELGRIRRIVETGER